MDASPMGQILIAKACLGCLKESKMEVVSDNR